MMKYLITDHEIVSHINGTLSKDEAVALKQKLINNGESEILLHAMLAHYEMSEEYANELLGPDDFVPAMSARPMIIKGTSGDFRMAAKCKNTKK